MTPAGTGLHGGFYGSKDLRCRNCGYIVEAPPEWPEKCPNCDGPREDLYRYQEEN
ncbi:DUF7130 family rubredoxin-like protein [Flindersiella endophytica]